MYLVNPLIFSASQTSSRRRQQEELRGEFQESEESGPGETSALQDREEDPEAAQSGQHPESTTTSGCCLCGSHIPGLPASALSTQIPQEQLQCQSGSA